MRGRAVWLALAAAQLVALGPARCRGFPAPAHPDWQETFSARDYKHDFCAVAATVLKSLREAPAGDPRGAGAGALRNALRGLNLSTAWPPPEDYEPPGLLEGDASGVISDGGAMAKIFDELARRAGFNWRNHYGLVEIPDGPEFEDKTWNELLIWSADVYDVSVDWWIETPSRKEIGIFFPQGWFDASLVLVAKKQGAKLNVANLLFSWSKPFAPELWFLVLVMFVFAGVVYWVVEDGDLDGDGKDRNKAEFQYKFKWQNVLVSILNTALEFAGGKWHTPHTFSGRVFTFGWLFARLLLISAYTANLASTFITDALENYGVESIEDAVSRELPICISGVVSGPLLKSLHPDIDLVEVEDDQMFSAINDGTCVGSVMSYDEWRIQMGIKELNPDCQFGLVGRNINYMQAGFAVKHSSDKCSWLVRDVLDLHLHDMTDDGFVDEVWKDHFKKTREQKCSPPSVGKPTQMKPSNTAGIFILMLLTSVLAMLLSSFQTATCAWGGLADGDDDGREEVRTTKRGKSSLKDKGGSFSGTETKGRGGAGRAPEPLLSASLVRPDHPAAYGQLRESFLGQSTPCLNRGAQCVQPCSALCCAALSSSPARVSIYIQRTSGYRSPAPTPQFFRLPFALCGPLTRCCFLFLHQSKSCPWATRIFGTEGENRQISMMHCSN